LLTSYQINKVIGLSAGIANTWAPGINNRSARSESKKTYMGAVTLTAPDSFGAIAGSALYAGIVDGYNSFIGNDVTSYYLGATLATPIKQLKLGAAWDYAAAHDNSFEAPNAVVPNHGYVNTVGLYASFQATEKLSLHARGEWARLSGSDFAGTITPPAAPVDISSVDIYAATITLQYDLWANVLSRLELRWDHIASVDGFGGPSRASGGPNKQDEVLLAANIIYKF
jgi:hypothetical protein